MYPTIADLKDCCVEQIFARLKMDGKLNLASVDLEFCRIFEKSCKPLVKEVSIVGNECRIVHRDWNDSEDVIFTVVSSEALFKVAINCIEILSINNYPSTDLQIPQLPNLQKLKLKQCDQYSRASLIQTFKNFNYIESLELAFNKDLGTQVMNELIANGMNIQHLAIDTKDDHANLNIITELPNLNSLDLHIGRRSLRSLLTALSDLKEHQLKTIIIRSNDWNYRDICLITNLRKLKRIVFSGKGICFSSEHAFKKLCELKDLEEVHIYNYEQNINERGAIFLLANCENIKNLSIRPKTETPPKFIYRVIQTLRKRQMPVKTPIGIDLLSYDISFDEKMIMDEADDVLTTRSFRREFNIEAK